MGSSNSEPKDGWEEVPIGDDGWEEVPHEEPSTAAKALGIVRDAFVEPAKKLGGVLLAPFAEMDKMTGAPPRAAVGAMQRGEGASGAGKAFLDQLVAGVPTATGMGQVLPTTPTGADIVSKEMAQRGMDPKLAAGVAPITGMVADAALDMTNLIPDDWAVTGLKGIDRAARGALGAAGNVAGVVERGVAKPLFGLGTFATQGNINYEKALRAANVLKARELILPGNKDVGALARSIQEIGSARQLLHTQEFQIPGSHEAAQEVMGFLDQAISRTLPTMRPNAESLRGFLESRMFDVRQVAVPIPLPEIQAAYQQGKNEINRLGNLVTGLRQSFEATPLPARTPEMAMQMQQVERSLRTAQDQLDDLATGYQAHQQGHPVFTRTIEVPEPRNLTLAEIDDIIVNMDNLMYTGLGNERLPKAIWTPAVRKSRRVMNEALNSVPAGELFQTAKTRHEGLSTAAKGRSKLIDIGGTGLIGTGIGTMASNGVNTYSLISMAVGAGLKPTTYFKVMGAVKAPGDMVRGMKAALDSGKLAIFRDWLEQFAERHPIAAEAFVRGALLAASKPNGAETLTEDDLKHLNEPKSFDADEIGAELERIASDDSMPSTTKARMLSEITTRGYLVLPQPPPQAPEMIRRPAEQKAPDLERIKNALKSVTDG